MLNKSEKKIFNPKDINKGKPADRSVQLSQKDAFKKVQDKIKEQQKENIKKPSQLQVELNNYSSNRDAKSSSRSLKKYLNNSSYEPMYLKLSNYLNRTRSS